jgi:membrane fusion protein, multidrug efflux system
MRDDGLDTISDGGEPSIARTNQESAPVAAPRSSPEVARTKPDSKDASGNRSAAGDSRSRWRRPLLVLGPVALVLGGLVFYFATGRYVTEEDAYVQAVNVSVSPQVAGQVVAIVAKSNVAVIPRSCVALRRSGVPAWQRLIRDAGGHVLYQSSSSLSDSDGTLR